MTVILVLSFVIFSCHVSIEAEQINGIGPFIEKKLKEAGQKGESQVIVIRDYEVKVVELERQLAAAKDALANGKDVRTHEADEIKQLQEKAGKQQKQLGQKTIEAEQANKKNAELTEQNESYLIVIHESEDRIRELERQLENLKNSLAKGKDLAAHENDEIKEIKERAANQNRQLIDRTKEAEELKKRVDDIQGQNEGYIVIIHEFEEKERELNRQLDEAKKALAGGKDIVAHENEELKKLQEKCANQQKNLANKTKGIEDAERRIKELETQIETYVIVIHEGEEKLGERDRQLGSMKEALAKGKDLGTHEAEEIRELQEKCANQQKSASQIDSQADLLTAQSGSQQQCGCDEQDGTSERREVVSHEPGDPGSQIRYAGDSEDPHPLVSRRDRLGYGAHTDRSRAKRQSLHRITA